VLIEAKEVHFEFALFPTQRQETPVLTESPSGPNEMPRRFQPDELNEEKAPVKV